jgi:hypothetical protein
MVDDMCFEEVLKVEIEVGKQAGVTVCFLPESLPCLTLSLNPTLSLNLQWDTKLDRVYILPFPTKDMKMVTENFCEKRGHSLLCASMPAFIQSFS